MNTTDILHKMHAEKTLTAEQLSYLTDIHRGKLFSIHGELRFFFYAGILLIIAGLGLTIKQYFAELGNIAVIGALTTGFLASFIYCFTKGSSFSRQEAASPNIAFDYILFFGCTLYSMDIAYIETQFHILGDLWNNYLLFSSALFLFLAYRYDNRLVLSLSLSTLTAWFGFTIGKSRFSFQEYHRLYAIAFSGISLFIGVLLYRLAVKKHFLDIYLNFAVHFLMIALISGVIHYKLFSFYFPALALACAALIIYSVRTGKFLYMLYAIIYGYIGISIAYLDLTGYNTFVVLSYFIITSLAVIFLIYALARRFKERA